MREAIAATGLVLVAGLLAGCEASPPEPPVPPVPGPTSTPVPSSTSSIPTSSPSVPPRSPSPSSSEDEPAVTVVDGFLAMRFDCSYVEDSTQDQWTTQAAQEPGFGVPKPGYRYAFDAINGRVDVIFPAAFGGGLGKNPIRVKSAAPGPGRVTVWVTKAQPAPDLDVPAAVATVTEQLTATMSTQRPPRRGECTVAPAAPLPPLDETAPDDTPPD